MDTRRDFLRKSLLLSGATSLAAVMPASIKKALAIDPAAGSTFLDAEHIVILMQENRSFDHFFGTLQGVRGLNDPRAITLPDKKPVWMQTDADGKTYAPFRLNLKDSKVAWMGSLPHSRESQVDAFHNGKYDRWLTAKQSKNKQYASMPLTMGHYTREDLPFTYAMADAFTVCDQHFCSGMTSTSPNRSFFWTGKVTHPENGVPKVNIRQNNYDYGTCQWQTFPELLEDHHISWKFYQNELSCGGGFTGEERYWLANCGCNILEYFSAYHVKFSERYVQSLRQQADTLPGEIGKLQQTSPSDETSAKKIRKSIAAKQAVLDNALAELRKWNPAQFDQLSEKEKNLYRNAFVINSGDPDFRNITTLSYTDETNSRQLTVPKGDVLHQFRADVNADTLPAVSWLMGPANFSDHPSVPWYGAWYVSEVLDILTKNPEVWKKTIFILTYDENDGYFDHVPPFSIPDAKIPGTGRVSAGIDTEAEHVRAENELKQGVPKKQVREAPIGLGFRIPMIIASPWSRGGKVCSEVFDHTSTLQFLETFFNKKLNKGLKTGNISQWRRTICGDLTSAFSRYENKRADHIDFLDRNNYVEQIYNAKFKADPTGFREITDASDILPQQEKGIRPSCALPYELYTHGGLSTDKKHLLVSLEAGNKIFGAQAAGSPFTVYAPGEFTEDNKREICRNWSFAVRAGDAFTYQWPVDAFEDRKYHLRLNGPNGFFREFIGTAQDPVLDIRIEYELSRLTKIPTGNVLLKIRNHTDSAVTIQLNDLGYKNNSLEKVVDPAAEFTSVLNLANSFGWYDFEIKASTDAVFAQRFAGHVESGKESFTDPLMGRL